MSIHWKVDGGEWNVPEEAGGCSLQEEGRGGGGGGGGGEIREGNGRSGEGMVSMREEEEEEGEVAMEDNAFKKEGV